MRAVLVLMAALGAMPALAEDGKVWVNEPCAALVQGHGDMSFSVSTMDESYQTECRVVDWPVSSPVATMECADKSPAMMEVDADGVMQLSGLAGVDPEFTTFYPKGDRRIMCD